jgi:3D (Asp-Asp-Asp) domain-containing protein
MNLQSNKLPWKGVFYWKNMKKIILPILFMALAVQPLANQAIAADKPVYAAVSEPKTMSIWVTAYSSVPEETDNSPFITATNKTVRDGFIAANFLPFGTQVKIPEFFGNKVFVVEDRMSRRKDNFMDVWMPTKSDALKFGIHQTNIVVVKMGTIPNPMPNPLVAKNITDKNPAE